VVVIGASEQPLLSPSRARFVALLPAYSEDECAAVAARLPELVELGCCEVWCVGPDALALEVLLHDRVKEDALADVRVESDVDVGMGCNLCLARATQLHMSVLALAGHRADLLASLARETARYDVPPAHRISFEATGPTTAYVTLGERAPGTRCTKQTWLHELIGPHRGPEIAFDFAEGGALIGIEILGEDPEEG
jgi:hypothetical protein